jgi:phosphosulfolactate phosphohydrolase-like enzyme
MAERKTKALEEFEDDKSPEELEREKQQDEQIVVVTPASSAGLQIVKEKKSTGASGPATSRLNQKRLRRTAVDQQEQDDYYK